MIKKRMFYSKKRLAISLKSKVLALRGRITAINSFTHLQASAKIGANAMDNFVLYGHSMSSNLNVTSVGTCFD